MKGIPYLSKTNPSFKSSFKGFFTLLIEGGNVEEFLEKLETQYFYTHKYKKCISVSWAVEKDKEKPFPVRRQDGVTVIPSADIVEGSRVAVMVEIEHWKGKEKGVEGLKFNMLWVRKLVGEVSPAAKKLKRETGEDNGPVLQ